MTTTDTTTRTTITMAYRGQAVLSDGKLGHLWQTEAGESRAFAKCGKGSSVGRWYSVERLGDSVFPDTLTFLPGMDPHPSTAVWVADERAVLAERSMRAAEAKSKKADDLGTMSMVEARQWLSGVYGPARRARLAVLIDYLT